MNRPVRILDGIVAACVLICSTVCASPEEPVQHQKSPIELPATTQLPASFRVQKWNVFVPTVTVSLNESRTETAAVATGLNANVISPETSLRLTLPTIEGKVKVDALNSSTVAGQAEVLRFRASTLDVPKFVFAVADVPKMNSSERHPDAPGVWLGTPFLSAFQLTLDPGSETILLHKSAGPLPRPKQASVAKLQIKDGRPYVQLTIPGSSPFWALIDTASPGTLIPASVGEKLKLKSVEVIPWPVGTAGKATVIIVPKLSIGKAEWKLARVPYISTGANKEYNREFAVLGMDFLRQFTITINFAKAQIVLSPPVAPPVAPTVAPADVP